MFRCRPEIFLRDDGEQQMGRIYNIKNSLGVLSHEFHPFLPFGVVNGLVTFVLAVRSNLFLDRLALYFPQLLGDGVLVRDWDLHIPKDVVILGEGTVLREVRHGGRSGIHCLVFGPACEDGRLNSGYIEERHVCLDFREPFVPSIVEVQVLVTRKSCVILTGEVSLDLLLDG